MFTQQHKYRQLIFDKVAKLVQQKKKSLQQIKLEPFTRRKRQRKTMMHIQRQKHEIKEKNK